MEETYTVPDRGPRDTTLQMPDLSDVKCFSLWLDYLLHYNPPVSLENAQCLECFQGHIDHGLDISDKPRHCWIARLDYSIRTCFVTNKTRECVQLAATAKYRPYIEAITNVAPSLQTAHEYFSTRYGPAKAPEELFPKPTFLWLVEDAITSGNLVVTSWLLRNKLLVETHGSAVKCCSRDVTAEEMSDFLSIAAASRQFEIFDFLRSNVEHIMGPVSWDVERFVDFAAAANQIWMRRSGSGNYGRLHISQALLREFDALVCRVRASGTFVADTGVLRATWIQFPDWWRTEAVWQEGFGAIKAILSDRLPRTYFRALSGLVLADAMRRVVPNADSMSALSDQRFRDDITNWYVQVPWDDRPYFHRVAKDLWDWTPWSNAPDPTPQQGSLLRKLRSQLGRLVSYHNDGRDKPGDTSPKTDDANNPGNETPAQQSGTYLEAAEVSPSQVPPAAEDHNFRDREGDNSTHEEDISADSQAQVDLVLLLTGAIFAAILAFLILGQFGSWLLDTISQILNTFNFEDAFSAEIDVNIRLIGLFLSLVWEPSQKPRDEPKYSEAARGDLGHDPTISEIMDVQQSGTDISSTWTRDQTPTTIPSLESDPFTTPLTDTTMTDPITPFSSNTTDLPLSYSIEPTPLPINPLTCVQCQTPFSNIGNLNKHRAYHCKNRVRKRIACLNGCGETFTQRHYMVTRHMREFCKMRRAG